MLFILILSSLEADEIDIFNEIYETHKKQVYKIAYEIVRNHHDAEEILDDVMMSVVRNFDKFKNSDGNDIDSQIVIYSKNAAINVYNKNKRRMMRETSLTYENDDGETEEIDIEDNTFDPEDIVIDNETIEIVQKYLMLLSEEQQDAVKLVCILGYSYAEAAAVLHITVNAVGLRILSSKKKLLKLAGGKLSERL